MNKINIYILVYGIPIVYIKYYFYENILKFQFSINIFLSRIVFHLFLLLFSIVPINES